LNPKTETKIRNLHDILDALTKVVIQLLLAGGGHPHHARAEINQLEK
jgi:hypothetical protein